jgi:hypothetical protein
LSQTNGTVSISSLFPRAMVHALQAPIQLGGNFGGFFDFFDFLASDTVYLFFFIFDNIMIILCVCTMILYIINEYSIPSTIDQTHII